MPAKRAVCAGVVLEGAVRELTACDVAGCHEE